MKNTGDKRIRRISIRRILGNNIYSFRLLWKYSKGYMIFSLVNTVISGLFSPCQLLLTRELFDSLEHKCSFEEALKIILIITSSIIGYSLWALIFQNILVPKYKQIIHLKMQSVFFERVRKMELKKYDDPEFYNEFILAMQNTDTYATAAITNLNNLLANSIMIITTFSIVVYIDAVIMAVMVLSTFFVFFLDIKLKKHEFQLQLDTTPLNHRKEYIDRIHKEADYAKELRLTDFGEKLKHDYDKNSAEYISVIRNNGKKTVGLRILEKINGRGVELAVITWTIYKMAVIGSVTLGEFSIIITSCSSFRRTLESFIKQTTVLVGQSMNIDKVRTFMEYVPEEQRATIPAPKFESIEFRDVNFGYNVSTSVLKNINMTINRGEKIAIVGYNGAGKSTLVKLLMHLYEPTSGTVLYNNRDYRTYEMNSYRSRIGVVFQDFKLFSASIGENVMADLCSESNTKTIEYALHLAGFDEKFSVFPKGIHTVLTREFDEEGVILSGGESQKIAIARVFAHPVDLVILDEPSSALDPVAEYTLNKNIREYTDGKTVIYISHRLSSTRHADRIYMLEDGKIIESGTHETLMQSGGKYAEMFNIQSKKYRKNYGDN